MTTSGVTAWSLTARDIITEALHENRIMGIARSPSATEMDKCLFRLNALLKSWAYGAHLLTTGTITVPADDASGTLAAGIDTILSARLEQVSGSERMMHKWDRDDYFRLPNKAQSGEPIAFYEARQVGGLTIYVWPVPTTERTLHIDYIREPETVTDLSQTIDLPERYQEALFANLAVRCAGLFGAQITPELANRAAMLERKMQDEDRPRSYTFEPSCQTYRW